MKEMKITIKREQRQACLGLPSVSNRTKQEQRSLLTMPCKEIKGKANNLRDKGANKIYKLFGFAACAALLLAGCDVTDPIYDSVGEVTLTTDWTNTNLTEAPAAGYTVAVGDQSAIITQNPASVENLFQPGTYTGYVYTAADKITVSGTGENTVATVTGAATPAGASGTFIAPDPAFFYSGSKEVTIEKNEEHDITVAMRQDVRELTFIIRPDGDAKVKVESINSAMNGIAGVWNLHTNTACGEAFNIAPVFTKNGDGDWTATVYLLGITGTEQKLSGSITFTTESNLPPITFEKDLRTATGFPAFNSEKKKPLALEAHLVSVHNQLELGDFTAIPDWTGNEEEVGGEVVIILDAGEELVDKVNDAVRQLPQVKIRGTKAMDADDFEELKDNFPNLAHLDISGTATTEIPTSAFHNKTSLHAIILPEGMKVVGNSAFRNSGLESIEIPASVGSVGIYAFYNCSSLKEATLVQGLEAIENNAFQNSGLESIAIPATVTTFGDSAFRDCSDLTEATLAEGLKVIGKYAFSNSGLESIAVPASVTTFGLSAFNGCTSLKSATLEDGLKVIGEYAFSNSGLISIEIPTSVENFGSYAFYYCSSLESATLADGLTVIGQSAFRNSGLTSIAIPASVRAFENNAFRSCGNLKSATLPEGLIVIGKSAFRESGLESIEIPSTIETFGDYAFANCSSLNSATLAEELEVIGAHAFHSSGLTSIAIPTSVETVGAYAFYRCSSLKSATLTYGLKVIGTEAFRASGLESIEIPSTIETFGDYAFANCSSLKSATLTYGLKVIGTEAFRASGLTSISIPSSVTTFGSYAFGFCPSLASAALADGLMVIGDNAFRASGLTSITIPASVTTIRGYAFESCGSLAEVVCRATAQPTLGTDAFTSIAAGAALYVPAAYVSDYEGGDWNSYFLGRIAAIP